jgi:vacuolar-type H+-ATPase subunit E/Vma4
MTIEEKMEHFRSISLESANNQSSESLRNYKKSLDDELDIHKSNATLLSEESKRAKMNQVKADSKKELASAQMAIKKQLTNKQAEIKLKIFELVREKIADYRKTPEYIDLLKSQISAIVEEYNDLDITIYIDCEDAGILEQLKSSFDTNIQVYDKEFLGGTKTIVPEKNILIDYSFKTRLVEEQEKFAVTF